MISFLAHLPSAIFTRRGSGASTVLDVVGGAIDAGGKHIKDMEELKSSLTLRIAVLKEGKLTAEKQLEGLQTAQKEAKKELEELPSKRQRYKAQLGDAIEFWTLLDAEIRRAQAQPGSVSHLKSQISQLQGLVKQIKALDELLKGLREREPSLWDSIRLRRTAIDRLSNQIKRMQVKIDAYTYVLNTNDPLYELYDEYLKPHLPLLDEN